MVSLLLLGATAASPQQVEPEGEADFLILQLRLRSYVLAEAVPALAHGRRVFLPLGMFCAALEFPVSVNPANQTARGWFRTEEQTIELDAGRSEMLLAGSPSHLPPAAVLVEPDDLYVHTALLEEWFRVQLEVDRSELQVKLSSTEPLPMEERRERERLRERALAARQALSRPDYPLLRPPHPWISWPVADVSLNGARLRNNGDSGSWKYSHSVLATAGLMKMTGELFVAGNDDETLSDLQLRLGRKDPAGEALGRLGATEFVVGDVFSPQNALVARGVRGRGAIVSSFPLDRPDEFDRTTIRGPASPRWEAELYRNGALLDFQLVGGDGRYEFTDVPVLYGRNLFEVFLYGPQGQKRRVPYPLYVGPGLIEPGTSHLRVALNQHETDLIPVEDGFPEAGPAEGEPRLLIDWERGLGLRVSVAASIASIPVEEDGEAVQHYYLGTGGRFTLGGVFTTLDGVWDTSGGEALQGRLQGRWHDANWFAEHGQFWNFESERIDNGDPLRNRTRARVEWGASLLLPLSVALEGRHESRRSGRSEQALSNRFSITVGRTLATNRLDWRRHEGGTDQSGNREELNGSLLLSTLDRGVSVRGELNYALDPATELLDTSLTADWSVPSLGGFRFRCGYAFATELTSFSIGWNRNFAPMALGVDAAYSDDGSYSAGLSATFSLGRNPMAKRWTMRSEPMAAKASAAVRVMLDRNGNGSLDAEDEPLQGVGFLVNQRPLEEVATGVEGEAFLPFLSPDRVMYISVDEASLEDPYWLPTPAGQKLLLRPGGSATVEFLVQETGEIEGTIYVQRGDEVREQSRVRLQLLNEGGNMVREVESAFDGFFLFERIPMGSYQVRVAPEQLATAGFAAEPPLAVRMSNESPVAVGANFVLEEKTE